MSWQRYNPFHAKVNRVFAWFTLGVVGFVLLFAWFEKKGLSKDWIGVCFLAATLGLYAVIGILCRTSDSTQFYVAGRKIPAFYNGMATAADWMSAASFIGLAGTLYLGGYGALAFVMGWTGGYCLIALLVAPYLRKFGQFTIPDFFSARYGGRWPRVLAALAAVVCSFVYVVAQIYAVGLIASRLTGVGFQIGIFLGLGGVLLCSFLGGMRAITWTQVAQYIVMIVAILTPVTWLAIQQTGSASSVVNYAKALHQLSEREQVLRSDPGEMQVTRLHRKNVAELEAKLANPAVALVKERAAAMAQVAALKAANGSWQEIAHAERTVRLLAKDEASTVASWQQQKVAAEAKTSGLGGLTPHAQLFAGDPNGNPAEQLEFAESRRNFVALVLCLMLGTAALPHVLTRFYTTSSVQAARSSVSWTLFFILLLYLAVPALAVLVKFEVLQNLVGTPIENLPRWMVQWNRVDPGLASVSDINGDGILQLGELSIGSDIILLAMPEIAGLPYVITALVAAGGLAAALSTADGLLLTIASALSHDLYQGKSKSLGSANSRVMLSKLLLLLVALTAAFVASFNHGDIIQMVAAAFSLAASVFFVPLVAGVFWRRANATGAVCAMLVGASTTLYYLAVNQPSLRHLFGISGPMDLWWGIKPVASGIFGVVAAGVAMVSASLCVQRPGPQIQQLIDELRSP